MTTPSCVLSGTLGFVGIFVLAASILAIVAIVIYLTVVWTRRDQLSEGSVKLPGVGFSFKLNCDTSIGNPED
jgi:hypothetical protein